MPYYEYHCKDCEKDFEIFQKISDPVKRKCPDCSGRLEKLVSASAFHLKGSGWYKTDYASPKKEKQDTKPKEDACSGCKSKEPCENKK